MFIIKIIKQKETPVAFFTCNGFRFVTENYKGKKEKLYTYVSQFQWQA